MIQFTCPTCGRHHQVEQLDEATNRPFCCQRCRDIDLGRWLNEEYVISDPLPDSPDVPDADAESAS